MKAISLFSGGLDSALAIKLVVNQGIDVIACNINTGFGATKDRGEHMRNMCKQVGAEFMVIDIQSEYLQEVLFDPKYGYGKHFNPCIDCHAKMFEVAKRIMDDVGASFLISGEVLGQRPMSQNADALAKVLDLSSCDGLLIRPLSAKLLAPTIAEEQGWVDREKLEGISGRSRDRQMELVKEYELKDYESPGGGCLLTDENFTKKMHDFVAYEPLEVRDIPVLKFGRHLRLDDGAKLVVGRNKDENAFIQDIDNSKFLHVKTVGIPGPHALLSSSASDADKALAAKIVLNYCKTSSGSQYNLDFDGTLVEASPFPTREEATKYSIL
ncbi:MAG: argininosuccinate synthase [Campylobacterota bacterium]|nr:argininosuccinate synthase [Campylobacterota bacterium]